MSDDRTDILGNSLTDTERAVLDVHESLKALLARDGLPPCVESNARHALAASWQMVTDLDLDYGPVEDA